MSSRITRADIERALDLPDFDVSAAQSLLSPLTRAITRPAELGGMARVGGIMVLLYPTADQLHLVLTRRRPDLASHPGQISFPGGRNEPPETPQQTALRETEEEIGVSAETVEVLGALTPIYIPPSDFQVYPFVGWIQNGQRPSFIPQLSEVAEIIELPVRAFLNPAARTQAWWDLNGQSMLVPHFLIGGYKVWGATAIMLSEFVERLRAVIAPA